MTSDHLKIVKTLVLFRNFLSFVPSPENSDVWVTVFVFKTKIYHKNWKIVSNFFLKKVSKTPKRVIPSCMFNFWKISNKISDKLENPHGFDFEMMLRVDPRWWKNEHTARKKKKKLQIFWED